MSSNEVHGYHAGQPGSMKIAISALNLNFDKGFTNAGMSRYCYGLIDALMRLPDQHDYIVFIKENVEVPANWKSDKRFKFVPPRGPRRKSLSISEVFGGVLQVLKFKPDVYLSTAHALPMFCRCPKAIVVHDLFPVTHPEFFTKRMAKLTGTINAWAMNKADVILANSLHTKREIHKIYKYPDAKVKVVYLGLGNILDAESPESVLDVDLERIGVPFKKFIFTIGTLEPRKNLPKLIEAFSKIALKLEQGYGLAIAGGKGWKDSTIFQSLKSWNMEDRVAFLGYVPDNDVPKLFARCEFFVFPSTIEGFGIPSLEAHHFGAPLVSSMEGALPEVAGPAAILFNPFSVDLMADALEAGIARASDRETLVAAGREFAKQFSWDRCARETLDAVTALVAK